MDRRDIDEYRLDKIVQNSTTLYTFVCLFDKVCEHCHAPYMYIYSAL